MLLLLALSFASLVSAQTPDPAAAQGCIIAGHVVNSLTGAPLRKTEVRLIRETPTSSSAPEPSSPSAASAGTARYEPQETVSDTDGSFSFTAVAPGAYRLFAQRNGFDVRYWGAKDRFSPGQVLRLGPGEKRDDIAIELIPLSVITGKVVDEDGDPVPGAQLQVLVPVYSASGRELQSRGHYAQTNDLGEYRAAGLQAGKYYLRADPPGGNMGGGPRGRRAHETLVAAYYPGSPDQSGAAPVDLVPGQQLNGIDFTLHMGHRVLVSGGVVMPAGANVQFFTWIQHVSGGSTMTTFPPSDRAGHFTLRGISPGDYVLGVRCDVAGEEYNAFLPLNVGSADIENIELHPAPPVTVSGRVRFDGPPNQNLASASLVLRPKFAMTGGGTIKIQSDGTFSSRGLAPDVYHLLLNTTAEAFLKEARWGDVNALESGLDLSAGTSASDVKIVVSTAVGSLDGTVQNDKQEALAGATVALRSEAAASEGDSYSRAGTRSVKSGADGKFHIGGLTPGRYRLMAWKDVDETMLGYGGDFGQLIASRGQLIEVGEGEHKIVSVQAAPKPEQHQ